MWGGGGRDWGGKGEGEGQHVTILMHLIYSIFVIYLHITYTGPQYSLDSWKPCVKCSIFSIVFNKETFHSHGWSRDTSFADQSWNYYFTFE